MIILRSPKTDLYLARWLGRWTWTLKATKAHAFGRNRQAKHRLRDALAKFPECVVETVPLPAFVPET